MYAFHHVDPQKLKQKLKTQGKSTGRQTPAACRSTRRYRRVLLPSQPSKPASDPNRSEQSSRRYRNPFHQPVLGSKNPSQSFCIRETLQGERKPSSRDGVLWKAQAAFKLTPLFTAPVPTPVEVGLPENLCGNAPGANQIFMSQIPFLQNLHTTA